MRDATKDDKVNGRRNTYGFERGDKLGLKPSLIRCNRFVDIVEVLRTWKYMCLVRSLKTGKVFQEYNWFLSPLIEV